MDKFPEKKDGLLRRLNFSKDIYFIIGIIVVLFLIIFSLSSTDLEEKVSKFLKCGDGTFSGYCSLSKSYFCENETLIENSSFCGCPENFRSKERYCISDYDNLSSEVYLDYLIYGVNNSLYFKFREDVHLYLSGLPRYKVYLADEIPKRSDFKYKKIDEPIQSSFLKPLVVEIENLYPESKDMQAKVAVSIVQNIPYNESEFTLFFGTKIRISAYPYEILGKNQGSCEEKSELLAYLLKELGFGVTLFYYPNENHEAVGIKCPIEESYLGMGYCFVETTVPSPISYSEGIYLGLGGAGKLESEPEIILISDGISLSESLVDYKDAKDLKKRVDKIGKTGLLNFFEKSKMNYLREKYGLGY